MRVADVMTKGARVLSPDAAVEEALTLLATERIRHLPVVEGRRVVGIVSDRDLLAASGADARGRSLGEVMGTSVATVSPEDTLVTASVEMNARKLGCLPVVDNGELVGMLTETDLLRTFLQASRSTGVEDPPVAVLQSAHPRTVAPGTLLNEALTIVKNERFRHLPVIEGGRLVGMLSERDLCRELGAGVSLERSVATAMSTDVCCVEATDKVSRAAELMLEHRISGLPVMNADELVGILSSSDLLEHCLSTL